MVVIVLSKIVNTDLRFNGLSGGHIQSQAGCVSRVHMPIWFVKSSFSGVTIGT